IVRNNPGNPWSDDLRNNTGYGKDEGRRCAIWNTVATDESEPGRDGMSLNSPRAGGRYFISRSAAAMVASRDERVKARLTSWLVDQRRSGIRRPDVMTTSIDDVAKCRDLTVQQRVDRLLGFIAERSPRIGATFSLTNQETTCAAMAWSESTNMEEVRFLLGHIEKRGWLETDESGPDQFVLTIDGHARLAELEGRDTGSLRAGGAENDLEADVGPHELPENIDFGVQHEAPDDERQARIDTLVEWFFERFEDPAHRLPYETAEGGFQWIYGGPFDAREQLEENFPDEAGHVIDAAVDRIESDGLTEWAPVSKPEDYGDLEDVARSREDDLNEIVRELDDLISGIPEPTSDPAFRLGDDGLVHMAETPDRQSRVHDGDLLEELRSAAAGLRSSLEGTNAHTDLLQAADNYEEVLLQDPISMSRLYGRGVRLENAARSAHRRIEVEDLPAFKAETEQELGSTLGLHAAYIMSAEDGRRLVEGAAAYRRTPDETAALGEAAERISSAVDQRPDVFSEEVRRYVVQVAQDVGDGSHPERSNQVAVTSLGNMTGGLLKWAGGAIVAGVVATSGPGSAAIAGGAGAINEIAAFLTSNAQILLLFAAAAGSELSWLAPIAHLLDRLRRVGKK
ncbi:MAG: hypothetical protein OXP75_03455, partial [Rhodospirillales bacterium]|nr:hypothetical protein [Rhodospirillales bacterium]